MQARRTTCRYPRPCRWHARPSPRRTASARSASLAGCSSISAVGRERSAVFRRHRRSHGRGSGCAHISLVVRDDSGGFRREGQRAVPQNHAAGMLAHRRGSQRLREAPRWLVAAGAAPWDVSARRPFDAAAERSAGVQATPTAAASFGTTAAADAGTKNNVPLPGTMPQACSPVAAADNAWAERLGGCLHQGQRRGAWA